ncbi:MAG: DNA-directed RNA polymerase subunit H [Nanoarchaeota archaeon]|nr:DNA-directed RNA polymerase subunit H [Nanoarchaeota archaeon]MBU4086442.1 DNA-directed RNA polymerase subunit H [Nanoarchaeota archaeon]
MHVLQPKHSKLKAEDAKKLLQELNVSLAQLPKITAEDPALPKDCVTGDVIKIERKFNDKTVNYYRVII